MKGKMKKIIAAVATLAMAAQFAFVLPASATITVPDGRTYSILYQNDYNDATTADWTSGNTDRYTVSLGSEDTNKWVSVDPVGNGNNGTTITSADYSSYVTADNYAVEFDLALTGGWNQASHFHAYTSGGELLNLTAKTAGGTEWKINDSDSQSVDLTAGAMYHVLVIYNNTDTHLTISNSAGEKVFGPAIIVPKHKNTKLKNFTFGTQRYSAAMKLDNLVIRTIDSVDESTNFGEREEESVDRVEFTSQLNKKITQQAGGDAQHFPITVKATGIYGNDLSDKVSYEWTTNGIADEDGYISLTAAEGTGAGTEGEAPGSTASTAYFNVRDGVSNWYGKVNVKVTYLGKSFELSTPFAVIGASGGGDNLAPDAGYPEDMSNYDDDLVDYKATANGLNDKDVVLNNWSIYGSNGARTLTLKKDADDTKYLQFASNGGSGSTVGVYQLPEQSSQYIVDMKVRFAGGAMGFGHYKTTPNNTGSDPNWTASYASGSLTVGTGSIDGLSNDKWYRVVVSADESSNKLWAKVFDGATLVGEVDDQELAATSTATQNYFCFMGTWPVDLASFRIYKPSAATVTVTGADSISVPGYDEKALRGKGLEDSTLYTYDATAHTLTVNAADIDAAKLIIANYDKRKLTSFDIKDLTFTSGSAVVSDFTLPDSCRLMLWKPELEAIEPLKPVEGTGVSNPNLPALTPATAELNAIAETSEGFEITGDVNWAIDSEDSNIILTPDKDDSHKATLTVKDGAPAGTVTVTASCGAASGAHEVGLTSSGNSIATTATTTSLTIPFAGEEAVDATFSAKTVDKDGADVEFAVDEDGEPTTTPAAITWSVLDKNLRDITNNMPAGITWDAVNHKITVTDQAKAAVLYVQAKNNDATPLSRNIKVNIHGMSFAFGTGEPEEGFTQVTAADAYTDKLGYGFLDASVVKDAAANVSGSADYRFKVKVPNGNYVVKVNTTSASVTSEVVESVTATTGITKSGSQFNVAVADGVLDLTFASGSTLSSLEIEQAAAKSAGDKPSIYAIGDSTTNNTGNGALSWGNYFTNNSTTLLAETHFGGFSNNGMAGRDSVNFYNQARVETVLLAVRPGDYVTINMGINSKETNEGASYETLLRTYYIDAVAQRGAIPVIVTATPDGPVGSNEAADYNSSTGKFTNNRGDGARNNVLRALAKEKGYNLIELGQAGEDWLNESTLEQLKAYGGDQDAANKLALVQSWYVDHNHYKEPMAKWISEYMIKVLDEIAGGSHAYEAATE